MAATHQGFALLESRGWLGGSADSELELRPCQRPPLRRASCQPSLPLTRVSARALPPSLCLACGRRPESPACHPKCSGGWRGSAWGWDGLPALFRV